MGKIDIKLAAFYLDENPFPGIIEQI